MRTLFFLNPSYRPLKPSSKRVENQLKDLGEKAEKKKLEVRAQLCTPHPNLRIISLLVPQLVEIQTALQPQTAPAA